ACRDVIDHDVSDRISAQRIVAVSDEGFAAAEAHVANDDVVRFKLDSISGDADPIARRAAADDADVRRADTNTVFQMNDASDIKNDDAWAARFAGVAKSARAGIFKAGDDDGLSAAASEAVHPAAFGAGERRDRR